MKNGTERTMLSVVIVLTAALGYSQIIKQPQSYLDQAKFRGADLGGKSQPVQLAQALPQLANKASWLRYTQLNQGNEVYMDANTGMPLLVNGSGIRWIQGDSFQSGALTQTAVLALKFMRDNAALFPNLPLEHLRLNPDRSGPFGEGGYLFFIDFDFVYENVPVDGARVVFRCNHGNMVQFGVEGLIPFAGGIQKVMDPYPSIPVEEALEITAHQPGPVGGDFKGLTQARGWPGQLLQIE